MFNYIVGKITNRNELGVVLENNGIGYEISMSSFALRALENISEEVIIYTYFQLKEDGVCLYGFCDKNEKDIFLKLISVSGTGPKGAMAILSNVKPDDLAKIIARQDVNALSSIKGVGRKTAERLVVELKDKVDVLPIEVFGEEDFVPGKEVDEAIEVLVGLGISKQEALKSVKDCYKAGDSAEELITKVFANMHK